MLCCFAGHWWFYMYCACAETSIGIDRKSFNVTTPQKCFVSILTTAQGWDWWTKTRGLRRLQSAGSAFKEAQDKGQSSGWSTGGEAAVKETEETSGEDSWPEEEETQGLFTLYLGFGKDFSLKLTIFLLDQQIMLFILWNKIHVIKTSLTCPFIQNNYSTVTRSVAFQNNLPNHEKLAVATHYLCLDAMLLR